MREESDLGNLVGELRATGFGPRYRWRVLDTDQRRIRRVLCEGTGDNYPMARQFLGEALQQAQHDRARNSGADVGGEPYGRETTAWLQVAPCRSLARTDADTGHAARGSVR